MRRYYTNMVSKLVALLRDGTLQEVKAYVKKHPESVTARDQETGRLALHDVLDDREAVHDDYGQEFVSDAYRGVSYEKIAFLLKTNPGSIKEKDNKGQLPLHAAALAEVHRNDKLRLLLKCFAGATKIRDCNRLLPADVAIEENHFDTAYFLIDNHVGRFYDDGTSFLHRALRRCLDDEEVPEDQMELPAFIYFLVQKLPECLRMKDEHGDRPLHTALKNGTNLEEVQLMMNTYPGALKVTDCEGNLPLHLEARNCDEFHRDECPRLELLHSMIENYHEALSQTNALGQHPFHLAVMNKCVTSEVLTLLYNAYPQCLGVADCGGRSSLHACLGEESPAFESVFPWFTENAPILFRAADNDGNHPLHLAANHALCPVAVIKILSETFPRALQLQGGARGDLPLHFAIDEGRRGAVVEYLLHAFPEGAARTNLHGQLPLHIACRPGNNSSVEVVDLLVRQNPGGLAVYDSNGWLPFHLACLDASDWRPWLVEYLIKKVEGTGLPFTKNGTAALFLACELDVNLDTIFLLVQHSRELFHGDFHSLFRDGNPAELPRAGNSSKRCKSTRS